MCFSAPAQARLTSVGVDGDLFGVDPFLSFLGSPRKRERKFDFLKGNGGEKKKKEILTRSLRDGWPEFVIHPLLHTEKGMTLGIDAMH